MIFRAFVVLIGVVSTFQSSFSQVTIGPNSPSVAADGNGGGGGVPNWSTASGTPFSSNNAYATITSQAKNKNTNYLHVTGFGFAIPIGSYIAGIKVEVEMFGTVPVGGVNNENSILLINGSGSRVGTDHSTGAAIATSDPNSYVTYGGTTDNWGGVLTYADINSANFGVALQYQSGSVNSTAGNYNFNVDHVRVTVTYAPGFDAVVNGCFNDGATWGRVSPGTAGIDYPDATIAASIPGGRTVTVCAGTTANCFALIMNSDLSASSPAVLTLANSTATLNVAGDILMLTTTSASGSFTAGTINITGGTVTAQGNLTMTADRNPPNATSQAIVFGGGTMTVNGNVTMNSDNGATTTTLNMNAANSVFNIGGDLGLGVGASLTNSAGTTGTINYKGSVTQIIRSAITYFNLTFSGGGYKTLEANTSVNSTLTMTSGSCDMGGLTLTLGTGSAPANKGTLSYTSGSLYNGTFRRWFDNSTIVLENTPGGLFPMGTPYDYRPFSVYFNAAPATGGTLSVLHDYSTPGVTTVSITDGASTVVRRTNMFWTITAANSFNIAANNWNVRIEGTNIGQVGLVTPNTNDLRITLAGSVVGTAGTNAGTITNPIVRRINLPAFSATSRTAYIGSVDAANSPLPIELVDFKARIVNDEVQVTWRTATELNNDFFTVERSSNGEKYESLGQMAGAGTSSASHSYDFTDRLPLQGTSYYRLRQTDYDGRSSYSKIVAVDFKGSAVPKMIVYPNPTKGNEINIEISGLKNESTVPVSIYDQLGKVHSTYVVKVDPITGTASAQIPFNHSLPSGIYILKAGDSRVLVNRLVVVGN